MISLRLTEILITNWAMITNWVTDLGIEYGVDPYIFAFFYIGLAPLVWISAALAIKNLKCDKPAGLFIFITSITFLSPYLYILYAGHNIPLWVYGIIATLLSFGAFNLFRKIRNSVNVSLRDS